MAWRTGINLQSVTLVALIESLLIVKVLSSLKILSDRVYTTILSVFAANYSILLIYSTLIHPEFINPLRHVPRGKWWLPRQLHHQLIQRTTSATALHQIAEETPNNGLIALRDLTGITLLVTKPHVVAELLVQRGKDFSKPENIRTLLGHLTGTGLIYLEGDEHKFMKKRSLPHFSFRPVKDLFPLMWNHALEFAEALEANLVRQNTGSNQNGLPGGKVEFTRWADKTTINVISTTVFGRDFKAHNDTRFRTIVDLLNVTFEPSAEMQLYLSLAVVFSFRLVQMIPWRMNKVFQETSASLIKTCVQMVRDKREAIKEDGQQVDILSNMIKSDDFSDNEIAGQLLTYLTAGNDTTAITLSWAYYLLAVDQARQTALRNELRESLGPTVISGGRSTIDIAAVLEHLPFLNGVISETLRLYPAIPVTYRTSTCETSLAGIPIPTGTDIIVSPWVINRSPKLWGPAADKFQPERWISREDDDSDRQKIDPTGGASSNYDFLTFLHGGRSCIGQGFARAELRCLLAVTTLQFEWSLDMDEKDVAMGGSISIKPRKGLHIRLKRVDGSQERIE